jgi:hypothetical protein
LACEWSIQTIAWKWVGMFLSFVNGDPPAAASLVHARAQRFSVRRHTVAQSYRKGVSAD